MSVSELILPFQVMCRNEDFVQFMLEDYEFQWAVSFEDILREHAIYSSVFPEDSDAQFKWQVTFRNNIQLPAFFLELKQGRICDLDKSVECCFFIKTVDGSTIIDAKGKRINRELWGTHLSFYDSHELLSKIRCVPLTFGVRVSVRYDIHPNSLIRRKVPIIVKKFICEKKYFFCLKDGTSSDVILLTEKDRTQFKVHRFMLTSRSKVFAAMFLNETKEKMSGLVYVQEFSGYIMRYVLSFIYYGTIDFPDFSVALNLLEAAEHFDLKDLKHQCAIYLLSFVDFEHAWQISLNARICCMEDVKASNLEYIMVHKGVLTDGSKYLAFPKDLLLNIVKAFLKQGFLE